MPSCVPDSGRSCLHDVSAYCVICSQILMFVTLAFPESPHSASLKWIESRSRCKWEFLVLLRNADLCSTAVRRVINAKYNKSFWLAPKFRAFTRSRPERSAFVSKRSTRTLKRSSVSVTVSSRCQRLRARCGCNWRGEQRSSAFVNRAAWTESNELQVPDLM